jgi:hypothetical protein
MVAILIITALLQGIPIAPQAAGTVSGVVKDAEGKPAAGVRVSAMTRQDPTQESGAVVLASIAETDQDGRYTIENIPPGQYYIVAGSIDRPTYYPGTQDRAGAKSIQITPGSRISGFDFSVLDTTRLIFPSLRGAMFVRVDLRVVAESGSRLPVSSPSGPLVFEFERVSDRMTTSVPASAANISLELRTTAATTEYRVRPRNLPDGFAVKSMTYGGVDLSSGILSLPSPTMPTNSVQNQFVVAFSVGTVISSVPQPINALTVTLGEDPQATAPAVAGGVRVTGIGRRSDTHPVLLSGKQGVVFSDGSFEFRGVPPGRHTIALLDSPGRALGITVVVGNSDIHNVTLEEIAALPLDIQSLAPGPVGDALPGTKVPPVVLRGVVLDRLTQQPPPSGQVWISGRSSPSYHFDAEGRFEVPGLLPGTYKLEVQVAGYPVISREITIGVEDLSLAVQIEK